MSRILLTELYVKNATSKKSIQADYVDRDTVGLVLRVTLKGKKTWSFRFISPRDSEPARMTLGTYPATGLKDARDKAIAGRRLVENGIDPRDVVIPTVETPKTIKQLIEERLALEVRGIGEDGQPKMRSAKEVERCYAKYVTPLVGDVAVQSFKIDPHYNSTIDPLRKAAVHRQAGIVHQYLSSLFDFAIGRGVIEYSPIAKVKRPDKKVIRERALAPAEIVTVWQALPTVFTLSWNTQTILKLLLVTGQRLGEVAGMTRDEIDLGKRVWTIPMERVKNKYEHQVPLCDLALSLIREAMRRTNGPFLFPNDAGDKALGVQAIDKTLRVAQEPYKARTQSKFGIPIWRCHDLRRTVATQMLAEENGLNISLFDVGLVLNHRSTTKATVTGIVYDKNRYLTKKRAVLEAWGTFLARLVGEQQEIREAAE